MGQDLYPLSVFADRLSWSVRSLTRALTRHQIAIVGSGRLARMSEADYAALIAKERKCPGSSSPPER